MNTKMTTKKLAVLSMLLTTAIILGYVEAVFPINIGIPGIKLGLPNLISVFLLYYYGAREGFVIGLLRVLIIGFLFTNVSLLIYSLSGFIVSFVLMAMLKKYDIFSEIAVSIGGAVMHNVTQLIIAIFITNLTGFIFYGAVLIVAGVLTGSINGYLSKLIIDILHKSEIDV